MKNLYIEVANSPEKREKGLMNRKKLAKNNGMIFSFPNAQRLSFWMKNTYIPLDIAFLDEDARVTQISEMIPLSTRAIVSKEPCRYALEVNKGWFKENDINIGSKVAGEGMHNSKIKLAQEVVLDQLGMGQQQQRQPTEQPQQPAPDVMLNKTFKQILEEADLRGQDLTIIYQTKDGLVLPPKVISPPFEFEPNADNKHDAIVKAWDNQTGGWKSFLIDNIMNLELVVKQPQSIEKKI